MYFAPTCILYLCKTCLHSWKVSRIPNSFSSEYVLNKGDQQGLFYKSWLSLQLAPFGDSFCLKPILINISFATNIAKHWSLCKFLDVTLENVSKRTNLV